MNNHSHAEYAQNELDMLALFRRLPWREQVILIGRMEVMAGRCAIIPFPKAAVVHTEVQNER